MYDIVRMMQCSAPDVLWREWFILEHPAFY